MTTQRNDTTKKHLHKEHKHLQREYDTNPYTQFKEKLNANLDIILHIMYVYLNLMYNKDCIKYILRI